MEEGKRPLFQKIDCVILHVPDLDQAIAFYQDHLGHQLVWRSRDAAELKMPETDADIVLQAGQKRSEVVFLVPSADEAVKEFRKAGGTAL